MPRDAPSSEVDLAGLVYVSDQDRGIRRLGANGVTRYLAPDGSRLSDRAVLRRIEALAIPPAWSDVWICPHARGHIQAVGRDARGRKQYRYHRQWREFRDEVKYARLAAFGRALPRLRAQTQADLTRRGLPRPKVLAAAARLLELTLLRVGNSEYARTNKSFGLTTLRKRHVVLREAGAVFEFRGKSGIVRRTGFRDRRLARVLRGCDALPGQRLFQYVDEEGERHSIESHDLNAYLREAMGEEFSAKDFRTWAGTLAAGATLAQTEEPGSEAATRKAIASACKAAASLLGNSPSICRSCYIHPAIFDAFQARELPPALAKGGRRAEAALLRLLSGRPPS